MSTSTSAIIILDLPPKTFVGIDLVSFNSSPNFHGITNLPVGRHFLYTGTDASLSIRHGRWFNVRKQQSTNHEIFVCRWNNDHESLDLLPSTDDAALAAINSIPSLRDKGLVDFVALQNASSNLQARQAETSEEVAGGGGAAATSIATATEDDNEEEDDAYVWPGLSSHITNKTLTRILSSTGAPTGSQSWVLSSISTSPQDNETIPGLDAHEADPILRDSGASALNFVDINLKQTWPHESIGRDRTEKARDKSWYLTHLIDGLASPANINGSSSSGSGSGGGGGTQSTTATGTPNALPISDPKSELRQRGAREVLAELQFCFLMVLTLANYSALEQWKRILSVVLGCKSALPEIEPYFVEVIKLLRLQLGRVDDVEGGLFEMADEIGSQWLRQLLRSFRANVDEMLEHKKAGDGLKGVLMDLEGWLRERYGWADEGNMLRKGMIELEDGERVEVQMDDFDEDEESGEYAPVVVEM